MTKEARNPKSDMADGRVGVFASFWRRVSFVIVFSSFVICRLAAQDTGRLRAERVGWARLRTPDPDQVWRRHARGDSTLMDFIREQTNLNIDPTWYVADIMNLEQMCRYPLLFSQGLHNVGEPEARANLAEYVRRGGFLLIDVCCNRELNPDHDVRLAENIRVLTEALPESQIVPLPRGHEVYRCFFQIAEGQPPHTYYRNQFDPGKARHGLYGVMIGGRMAGVISVSGLQCGWDRMVAPPGHDVECMRMLVNIYIHAMLEGDGGAEIQKHSGL